MIKLKQCSKCLIDKPFEEFYKNKRSKDGHRSNCIQCGVEYKKSNSDKIKEQIKQYNKKRSEEKKIWSKSNIEKVNESRKKWNQNNKEIRQEYLKIYNREYYEKNKEKRLEYSKEKQKFYRETKPLYKLKSNLRRRINRFIKNKTNSTEDILGINFEDFSKYFESKFTEGMSWELIGVNIHIDHIIPLSSAKTEEELYKLCHYTNLQPLWAEDNLKKGGRYLYGKDE